MCAQKKCKRHTVNSIAHTKVDVFVSGTLRHIPRWMCLLVALYDAVRKPYGAGSCTIVISTH